MSGRLARRLRDVQSHSLYPETSRRNRLVRRPVQLVDTLAVRAGATTVLGRQVQFAYRGYKIPVDLATMTGGGPDTWEAIALAHLDQYERWCPIARDHDVLEIGCGIGRDAVHLAWVLSTEGSYVGVDIVEASIDWCRRNITVRHPNVRFVHLDVNSEMYNAGGASSATTVSMPFDEASFDRVVLHSVFTHMFSDDVSHYLGEIRRVLRPGGLALASFFVIDDESLAVARSTGSRFTFEHRHGDGCYVNDRDHPEAAVGYAQSALISIVESSGLHLRAMHRGHWSGAVDAPDGQDVLILEQPSC